MDTTPEAAAILAKPLHAVLGLNRPGEPPHLSVVWFEWDGEDVRFSTTRSRAKYRHLVRDPAVSLLVNDPECARYVLAYGEARLDDTDHAALSRRLFARYLPGQDPGATAHDPDRVVIAFTPTRMLTGS